MSYKIINNLSPKNHGDLIKSLILKSDEVVIASPFLFLEFKTLLTEMAWDKTRTFHLITTLPGNSEDQFKKIASLKSLSDQTTKNQIKCRISIDNSLHGKLYIFKSAGRYHSAIISSANCTHNGFYAAREWGVQISEHIEIGNLHTDLIKNLDYDNIQPSDITKMYQEADAYKKKNGITKPKKIPLKLTKLITSIPTIRSSPTTKYFLKPIGSSSDHIKSSDRYDRSSQTLHFAKTKPKDIEVGDIFIAFAVGSGRIISIYRMKTPLMYTNVTDRWPWYMEADNLTIDFAKNWWENNLTKEYLKIEFDSLFPGKGIKPIGHDQGYGAFQYGRDRMKITQAFGKYIIGEALRK
jgi:HKD family nuclease